MRFNLKTTNLEMTPEISVYAEKLSNKIGQYFHGSDVLLSVELGKVTEHHKNGDIFRAEVRLSGSGTDYYAAKEASTIFSAIDEVKDEIMIEIQKGKDKKQSLLRRGGRIFKETIRKFPWF